MCEREGDRRRDDTGDERGAWECVGVQRKGCAVPASARRGIRSSETASSQLPRCASARQPSQSLLVSVEEVGGGRPPRAIGCRRHPGGPLLHFEKYAAPSLSAFCDFDQCNPVFAFIVSMKFVILLAMIKETYSLHLKCNIIM